MTYNLGLIYLARREHERALGWFKRAVQTNSDDRDAKNYISQLSSGGKEDDG